jgi:hypothetical protein
MTLPEVFQLEGIPSPEVPALLLVTKFMGGRKASQSREPMDWTKATDGSWYAEGWRFIPAIAKLGDLQGAFDFVGRKGPATFH